MAVEKNANSKKVVVIDDEEDVLTYLDALLKDHGYEVYAAQQGRDGLNLIKRIKPDLICLDILMPGETGISLYRRIRNDNEIKDVPVLIISGMNYRRENGELPPPQGYIEKPITPDSLIETVKALIG